MSTQDKCPNCGEPYLFINEGGSDVFSCGSIGSLRSDYCKERASHAETRQYDVRTMVPGTYGEALEQGWIKVGDCEPHEWDNRTSAENLSWVVGLLKREREKWEKLRVWAKAWHHEATVFKINCLDAEAKEGK